MQTRQASADTTLTAMAKLGEGGYDLKAQVQACACSDVETGFQAPSTSSR